MGTPSFNEPEITHKSKNMKLIATLAAAATAQQLGAPVMPAMPALPAMPGLNGMNPLMMMTLLGDDSAMDSDLLMMMMLGGQGGMGQMNPLMLSMLLDDSSDKVDADKLKKICDDLDAGAEKTTCESNYNLVINPITKLEHDCTASDATATCADDKKKALADIKALNKSDISDLLMLSMMSGQGMGDMNGMLPLLLMKDGGLGDNKMLMLMMMQGGNMGAMNPLLMMSLLE